MSLRPLLLALVVAMAATAPVALAQVAGAGPIEQQMSAAEFAATGLDKLDAAELARLNAWLNRTLEVETGKAAVQATEKVKQENRGFFSFGSNEPIVARIAGEFRGFGQGREYTLDNGQVWRQIDATRLVGARMSSPEVRITPALIGNSWYMAIEGYNSRARVERSK